MFRVVRPGEGGRSRTYYLRVCILWWTPLVRVTGIEPAGICLEGSVLTVEETPAMRTNIDPGQILARGLLEKGTILQPHG